jgi:hypothetical protein
MRDSPLVFLTLSLLTINLSDFLWMRYLVRDPA